MTPQLDWWLHSCAHCTGRLRVSLPVAGWLSTSDTRWLPTLNMLCVRTVNADVSPDQVLVDQLGYSEVGINAVLQMS